MLIIYFEFSTYVMFSISFVLLVVLTWYFTLQDMFLVKLGRLSSYQMFQ